MKTAMTDEEKRIAIAEYCGWKLHETGIWIPPSSRLADAGLPDFLNSLDAMYLAEESLKSDVLRDKMTDCLMEFCNDVFPLWHATARQRAEAFLKTIQQP